MARFNPDLPLSPRAVIRVVVTTRTQGVLCENTFDYMWSAPGIPSVGDLLSAESGWEASFKALYMACLSPKTDLASISVADIGTGVTPTQVALFVAGGTQGTAGATSLPLETAATVQRYTTTRGQKGRGRFQMPAVPNTFVTPAVDPSVLNAAGIAAYVALANQMLIAYAAGVTTWQSVVTSRPIPPATLTTRSSPIFRLQVQPTLGTVRTRKPGRGI